MTADDSLAVSEPTPESRPEASSSRSAETFRAADVDTAARTKARRSVRAEPYLSAVREAAAYYSVPTQLVIAVILVESAFDPKAVSSAGAMGLMQLMPDTARAMLVEDPFDPRQNVHGGTRYLRILLNRFEGNVALALAGYHAGPEAVERWGGIPPYPKTTDYVRSVLALYHWQVGLRDPPPVR